MSSVVAQGMWVRFPPDTPYEVRQVILQDCTDKAVSSKPVLQPFGEIGITHGSEPCISGSSPEGAAKLKHNYII